MNNDDVVTLEDLAQVKDVVLREQRIVLGAAVVTSLLAGLLLGLLVYYLKFHLVGVSTFAAAIFVLLGVPIFIHWWRHYQSVLRQLGVVAEQVASGETVYGSKVVFHS